MRFPDDLQKMFGIKTSQCDTCREQTSAFGVRVCRLDMPKPTEKKPCGSWVKNDALRR